ncbi:MAG: hypothetical protein LUH51_06335, partial [Firmicutes bacterium]|nr:hypothetical protein [Bacillota bacterium]
AISCMAEKFLSRKNGTADKREQRRLSCARARDEWCWFRLVSGFFFEIPLKKKRTETARLFRFTGHEVFLLL